MTKESSKRLAAVYYRISGRSVVHLRSGCPRLKHHRFHVRYLLQLQKKPSHTTICDHCQALDARDKRMAKRRK